MSRLTDIKNRIKQLEGGAFQELCDAYLCKLGYPKVLPLGMKTGTMKTTTGIPDTYFISVDGKYILVMYTTQEAGIVKKIRSDIDECLNKAKTGLELSDITEIIYCHTSSNISAGDDKALKKLCSDVGITLQIIGIDGVAYNLYSRFHLLAHDLLGISISTGQIMDIREFVEQYDSNKMAAPLSNKFLFRDKELSELNEKLNSSSVVIISGPAGVGKTKIALECCEKFSMERGYKLFCIQSNRLPIYEDLTAFLDTPGQYLILVDDANELSGLDYVLQYITKSALGYTVKIILTVRDYAKEYVIKSVRHFIIPETYSINTFSDSEIKKLLEESLQIFNTEYSEQIVRISEGNARIAILAGKLAVEKQTLTSIRDASEIYEAYYGTIINNSIIKSDRRLAAVGGIIAFLSAINLEHFESLSSLLSSMNISGEEFNEYAYTLHENEIVDIYNDKAAKISDQCLGNYLLKYIFVDENIIPLSILIEKCFPSHPTRVISTINILGNIFQSDDVISRLNKEIEIAWDYFKNLDAQQFFEFVKSFYSIRPTETLLMIREKIKSYPSVEFNVSTIDFEKEKKHQRIDDDILEILGSFSYSDQLPTALELLFEYYKKSPDKFMCFYHTITTCFGVDKNASRFDYYTQKCLFTCFTNLLKSCKNENFYLLFVRISAEFLRIEFQPSEAGRKNTITIYTIPIQYSSGTMLIRNMIWTGLAEIYSHGSCHEEIEKIIKEYGGYARSEIDKRIIENDLIGILKLFDSYFSAEDLKYCILAGKLTKQLKRYDIDTNENFKEFLCNPEYRLYVIICGEKHLDETNYKKERELKHVEIEKLVSVYTKTDIDFLIKTCSDCASFISEHSAWSFKEGIMEAFDSLSKNPEIYAYAIGRYLKSDTPLDLFPDNLVKNLFSHFSPDEVYHFINQYDYKTKFVWLFSFFSNLPQDQINVQYTQKLYDFLALQEDITSSPLRRINFLESYKSADPDVFLKACRILVKKYDYSPFMFYIYFDLLFNPYENKPENLIEKFHSDEDLLLSMYFKLIEYDKHTDYDGEFLCTFIDHFPNVLGQYFDLMLKDSLSLSRTGMENRLSSVWKSDNYQEQMNRIMSEFIRRSEVNKWMKSSYLREIFVSEDQANFFAERQDVWISHYIQNNYSDSDTMLLFFEAINEISDERKKVHILQLIQLNPDPELFCHLSLEPSMWGGWGSLIPYMEKRISFLKSLLPHLSGLKYLEHKQKIENDIKGWEYRIEAEQVDEIMRT